MNLHGFGCGVALEVVRGGAGDPSIIENATNSIKLHGFGGGVGGAGGPRITGNRPKDLVPKCPHNPRTTLAQRRFGSSGHNSNLFVPGGGSVLISECCRRCLPR